MFYPRQLVVLICLLMLIFWLVNLESDITQAQGNNPEAKLSHKLQLLTQPSVAAQNVKTQAQALSLPASGPGSLLKNKNGDLLVYIQLTDLSEATLQAITNAGANIIHIAFEYNTVTAYVGADQLATVAAIEAVENIREELTPWITGTRFPKQEKRQIFPTIPKAQADCPSALTSEGDIQLNVANARATFDLDGTNITVGVLSDSYDNSLIVLPTDAAIDIVSGDLPGPNNPCGRTSLVNIIKEGPSESDEGRAMLQIIHDLAPGSNLAFASAFFGQFDFADQIHALQDAGVDIMVDDILYFTEPIFQDGPISVAIADVTTAGALYFTSAGNSHSEDNEGNAITSYEAPAYRPISCPVGLPFTGDCHDFDPTPSTDNDNSFTLEPNSILTLDLQWAEPWNGVTTNLDIYLLDDSNTLLASSVDQNPAGTEIPIEFFSYINNSQALQTVRLVINRVDGTNTPRLKYILIESDGLISTEYNAANSTDIFGSSLFGHAGANEALSVAAIPYNDNDTPESFTAHGFPTYYFGPADGITPAGSLASPETRQKPDVTATDGNRNTFFGAFQAGFNRFFGTSAAAPHAAAIAALLQQQATLQGNPLDQSTAETLLETTAATIAFGAPEVTGAGLIDTLEAIQAVVDSSSVTPTPTSTPTTTPQPDAITLAINGPTSVEAGETFSATVEARDVGGLGLYGAQFDLNFDPGLVSAANLQVNPDLNFVLFSTIDNDIGRISLVASRQGKVSGLVGEVTLLTFDITAAETPGTATLTFDNVTIGDPQAQAFDVISQTYSVLIGEIATSTPAPTGTSISPTNTATPTPANTPTPTPNVAVSVTATDTPSTATPATTGTPTATPTPAAGTPPTSTPTSTGTPPTSTPTPTGTPPTNTPTPIPSVTTIFTATGTPATATPATTETPTATPTPATGTPPTNTPTPTPDVTVIVTTTGTPATATPVATEIPTSTPSPTSTVDTTTATVGGQVILPGRASNNWSDATVTIDDTAQSGTTDADGNFDIADVAIGTHSFITVNTTGFLSAVCTFPIVSAPETNLLAVTLLSGDVNDDDVVDIIDATTIGAIFGNTGSGLATDINRDDIIDVLDIILVGVNFGIVGPQEWVCQ